MDTEKLRQKLYNKMAAEQEQFKHRLLGLTPEEALNHAFEFTIREDIMKAMEIIELSAPQMTVLLDSLAPLSDIFEDFRDTVTGQMECVCGCIEGRAKSLLEAQREATRAIPLYRESVEYAKEHSETELFWVSYEANVACQDAIDTAIREGYDGAHLNADVKSVLSEFGPERVSHVLAAALLDKTWDKRISGDNMAWALSVPMCDTGDFHHDFHHDYAPQSHSLLLDGFVRQARKEMDAMQKQAEKKPSIKAQLVANLLSGDKPASKHKEKGQEAR